MKFKNSIFVDEKFMETIQKCNEYEDWEPKGAYWFNRLVKKLRSAQEDFEDTRLKLVKKFADEPDKEKIPLHTVIWLPDTCEIIDLTAFQATRNEKSLWVHPYWTSIFDLTKLRTAVNDNGEKIMTTGADIILPHQYEIKNGVDYDISPLVWFFPKEQTGKLWYKQFESVDEGETAVLLAACFLKICKATMQKEPSTKQILKWAEELVEMEEVITINPSHVKGVMEALNQVLLMGGFPHLPVKMMGGETLNNVNKARSAYGMSPL